MEVARGSNNPAFKLEERKVNMESTEAEGLKSENGKQLAPKTTGDLLIEISLPEWV